MLAQQLLTSKIAMLADQDRLEAANETLDKDLASCRQLLDEAKGEKQLLSEEAEQLKMVLKREVS